ncbi:MAG: D-tyrosyl-tRNA(Tyr) deacylase [Gammaproteobacteria bacterium]|nr:D-tyrosyl-tRNA(Tyr) deacylase [Gammaproteobacteria bacterium]
MIALVQRVIKAEVCIDGTCIGRIGHGMLALVAVERGDTEIAAEKMARRLLAYRIFSDSADKMNLSLADIGGGLLLVSQFTLAADTNKGLRPNFTPAAPPDEGQRLFDHLFKQATVLHDSVETGVFGADMQVTLTNDGPVTFWLQVH